MPHLSSVASRPMTICRHGLRTGHIEQIDLAAVYASGSRASRGKKMCVSSEMHAARSRQIMR
jgi:hypothetical protein